MFTQFTQFNPAELQAGKGSGLGLWSTLPSFFFVDSHTSVSRNIVDSHGGRIDVLSQYGNGSKFFFDLDLLPRESAKEGLLQSTENDLPTMIENPSTIIGLIPIQRLPCTLIVDDSLMNRKLMRKLLSSHFDRIDEVF